MSAENGANYGIAEEKTPNVRKITVALAGNPNVGKSTLFNRLTGMRQHTGNWPGKTVGSAYGYFSSGGHEYILADIPGTYSLAARSTEEEVARDALLFGEADIVLLVCDATCLQRNLNLALQIMEISGSVIIAVNLMDEAERKGITVDTALLSQRLGVPVIPTSAGSGEGINELLSALDGLFPRKPLALCYGCELMEAVSPLTEYFDAYRSPLSAQWLAMRVCENDGSMVESLCRNYGLDPTDSEFCEIRGKALENLKSLGITSAGLSDLNVQTINSAAAAFCEGAVTEKPGGADRDGRIDRILTHKLWGWAAMIAMLALTLWITISAANLPSRILSGLLFGIGDTVKAFLLGIHLPEYPVLMLMDGIYKTSAWVVAVMLPPMAIFFPLFTLLEDLGYLPRVAFNLDGFFKKCDACGKQSLTMCMGFGCNAVGVTGCRIIDSPRERLIAVLTNSFVPCNGRFPTLIALITIFFAGAGLVSSISSALLLTAFIILGVIMTLVASKLLSKTVLRGVTSSFTLELPPYRKPRIGEIIVRSLLDRTLFVLGRAVKFAAPAGLVIWLLANIDVHGTTLLACCASFLDPIAVILGLDGVILLAFIIGIPANEIVVPIILMCYLSGSNLIEYESLEQLKNLLLANGWSSATALCTLLFTLFHWPCATTLMTIKKETGSIKYTLLAVALPTVCGIGFCAAVNLVSRLF